MSNPTKDFYTIALPWLAQKVLDKAHFTTWIDPTTGQKWDFRLWMLWAARHGFVYFWPSVAFPTGGIIARRISLTQLKNWRNYPEHELLYVYDPDGEGAWVDFLWAPGQQLQAAEIIEKDGIKWVGWEHRKTGAPHLKTMKAVKRMISLGDKKTSPIRLI